MGRFTEDSKKLAGLFGSGEARGRRWIPEDRSDLTVPIEDPPALSEMVSPRRRGPDLHLGFGGEFDPSSGTKDPPRNERTVVDDPFFEGGEVGHGQQEQLVIEMPRPARFERARLVERVHLPKQTDGEGQVGAGEIRGEDRPRRYGKRREKGPRAGDQRRDRPGERHRVRIQEDE